VFKTPELGASGAEPIRLMDEITAPDPRTVVIKWKTLYPNAGVLSRIGTIGNGGFQPLPRHKLFLVLRARFFPEERAEAPTWRA
jgi:hypothetical protein